MKEDERLLWEAYTDKVINETVNNPATRDRVSRTFRDPDISDDQRADILQVLQTLEKMSAEHVPAETIQGKLRQAIERFTRRGGLTEKDPGIAEESEPGGEEHDQIKNSILQRLVTLDGLLPDDAQVQWFIETGSYGGINAHDAAGEKPNTPGPEHYTIDTFIQFLKKVWEDEEYAASVGLSNADWSGESSHDRSIFWTANDTHYQNVFDDVWLDRSRLKPEHEAPYREFQAAKRKTDTYVKAVLNGRESGGGEDVSAEDFVNQKDWRIYIKPRSEEVSARARATGDAVFPKDSSGRIIGNAD